jgi:dTDP-4-dehydrorhamnose 3,5-epimerase
VLVIRLPALGRVRIVRCLVANTAMKVRPTELAEVLILEPTVFGDDRGFFFESWNKRAFAEATGLRDVFVQDNHSGSSRGVLRGLHFQRYRPQGKLVRCVAGSIFDVAVDIRRSSASFGKWVGVELSAANRLQLWMPGGFAHGILVTSEFAEVLYKATDYYDPGDDRSIRWDDPRIGIDWPLQGATPILSAKDRDAPTLESADVFD